MIEAIKVHLKQFSLLGVTAILVGILGVIGPIGWDYYKTKSEIQLMVIEKSVIISKPDKLDDLEINYAGEHVDELSRMALSLSNNGRTPVLRKDVASPITVKFSRESNIIDAKIDGMQPPDLDASLKFDRYNGSLVLDFPLLNPGDTIDFSVLAKTSSIEFVAGGRIAGISSLHVVKEIAETKAHRSAPWTVYPVGFFSGFCILVSFFSFNAFSVERRIKNRIKAGTFELPKLKTKDEWTAWVNSAFYFASPIERAPLIKLLGALPAEDDFATLHRERILSEAERIMAASTLYVSLSFLGVAALGAWYIFSNL